MAWPPSSRVVNSSTWLLEKFSKLGLAGMLPNFLPNIGGTCSMEQSGATVAINDLLVSVHGHDDNASMVLFPGGWPAGQSVRFERIRTKGAFVVSAAAVGAGDKADGSAPLPVQLTAPVDIASLAGQNLTVAWAAGETPTVKAVGGAAVPVEAVGCGVQGTLGLSCYRFATAVGGSYTLQ